MASMDPTFDLLQQVVNQERETQKLKAKKKEMHLRHMDLSERLKTEEKTLKEAEGQYTEMENTITELENRRDFMLQQKQSEIDESEKDDKLKDDNTTMIEDLLQSTLKHKREFAKKMRTEIQAKRRYFLPSLEKTTKVRIGDEDVALNEAAMELKMKDLTKELCEKSSTKLPIHVRLEIYSSFIKALCGSH